MSDEGESDDPWANYSSGPFCRHWGDPSGCDERCAACSHTCAQHHAFDPYECTADDCKCEGWVEPDEPDTER